VNLAMLQSLLRALSAAFRTSNSEDLLGLFSDTAGVTYAGSESGEKATGPADLRRLFTALLARPMAYSFEFDDITFSEHHETVWLLADGYGTQTADDGTTEVFPYRLAGVLAYEGQRWRWRMLACSEPTLAEAPSQVLHPKVLLDVRARVLLPVNVDETQSIRHDVSAGLREHHVGPGLPLGDGPGHHH